MTDLNLPKGWTATAWEVRYGDARIRVSRRWQEYHGGTPKKLITEWALSMTSNARFRDFDGVTSGEFDSEGDLILDLATVVVKAKKALAEGAKEWAAIAAKIP